LVSKGIPADEIKIRAEEKDKQIDQKMAEELLAPKPLPGQCGVRRDRRVSKKEPECRRNAGCSERTWNYLSPGLFHRLRKNK